MIKKLFGSIPKYEDFKFWFLPADDDPNTWLVIDRNTRNAAGCVNDSSISPTDEYLDQADSIIQEFDAFKSRPEYHLIDKIENIESADQESLISEYERKLLSLTMIKAARAGKNPDANIKPAIACIEWLRSTDFYVAPASTQYHDSEPSGLLKHSLRVFNHIVKLKYYDSFYSVSLDCAVLVSLTHDWCKIGTYEMYMRNVKNEDTGRWEQVPSYRHNQKSLPLGHGVSSMFFASKFFKLSAEEAVAIRWHMGEYNVAPNESSELHLANESFPLVFLIQFADRLAITKYAN